MQRQYTNEKQKGSDFVASSPLLVSFSYFIVSKCPIMGVISGIARSLIRSSKKYIFKERTHCKVYTLTLFYASNIFVNTPKVKLSVFCSHQNACSSDPCFNNATCLSGFTDKKYLCVCPAKFAGENCEKGEHRQ